MSGIGHNADAFNIRNFRFNRLQNGHKGQIRENHFIFSVIDNIDQLLGKQARVQRVIHAANAGNAIPSLNMAVGVPRQSGDDILLAHAEALQRLAQLAGAQMQLRISFAMDIAFNKAWYDFALTVIDHGMVKNTIH